VKQRDLGQRGSVLNRGRWRKPTVWIEVQREVISLGEGTVGTDVSQVCIRHVHGMHVFTGSGDSNRGGSGDPLCGQTQNEIQPDGQHRTVTD
jgi:hypothetical protein